eukprot:CAMPEP_0202455908 /NCGR_PEP_ID=MMETSP1360-20130828/13317_1 /ASSEMBLY_ACC=CAM_ASM_000848 /TAXON_ID=515479 /ORGANISM="Licmophora paradoxa, Strain CCMP2313" /LENGTH=201 /DNA_ID=CAMNT_0049075597 /DNA_START=352 /DNA_END=957 /DNA_ORIENTATION=+
MVVTNKEQEKALRAYTCKSCGSTIFIARNREWFFEGNRGLGGLGCYTCGAKGSDNFVMDRDRIVEEVGDDDDYFDYERPLDFVTRAERRALLKKAKGDEELANQMLTDMGNKQQESAPPIMGDSSDEDAEAADDESAEAKSEEESEDDDEDADDEEEETKSIESDIDGESPSEESSPTESPPDSTEEISDDDLDILNLDDD